MEGDLISYWTPGIRIYPIIKDHGGFLIVLLSLAIIVLVFRPNKFIKNPLIWSIVLGFALVLDTVYQIGKLSLNHAEARGEIGAPMIQIGLIMVSIGSILLFITSVSNYFKPRV
jgi:hypothetical protein